MKIREIAGFLGAEIEGDGEIEISGVAAVATAAPGTLTFVEKAEIVPETSASVVLVPLDLVGVAGMTLLRVKDPKLAFARAAGLLHPARRSEPEIHTSAVVARSAAMGSGVFVGAFTVIGENSSIGDRCQLAPGVKIGSDVSIGEDCVFHSNVTIEDGCLIGNNVILHAGVVIGADGFGYVRDDIGVYHKFPQIGKVVVEDGVEIGANSCIDRGALGETRIGEGSKIDNLVQIAHNVQIGKRVIIAAQTGISGSTVIEDDCVIGGQVGMGDHARVQSGAIIGSQAGVLPGKIVRPGVWWGTPVQPLDEYKRQNAHVKSLGRMKSDIKELKKRIGD